MEGANQQQAPPMKKRHVFTAEELCQSSPSPTRRDEETVEESDEEEELGLDHFVMTLGEPLVSFTDRFTLGQTKTKMLIVNIQSYPDPEEMLKEVLETCISKAKQNHEEHYRQAPDHLGVMISSEHLDNEICEGIRPLEKDTTERIMNLFAMVSNRDNLLGAPFTITIQTANKEALPVADAQQELSGSGPGQDEQSDINEAAIIKIDNKGDHFCLFYALELSRTHKKLERKLFYKYLNIQKKKQRKDIEKLMTAAGVPLNLESYDASVYIPSIVDIWNEKYLKQGSRYKVFIFESSGKVKPIYQYGPDNYNEPICILFNKEAKHFDGIRRAGSLFGTKMMYCFHCECIYKSEYQHSLSCKGICLGCGRVRIEGSCMPDEKEFNKRCSLCNRFYQNKECFTKHQVNGECRRRKECAVCSKLWCVKDSKNCRLEHVCVEIDDEDNESSCSSSY